MKKTLAFALTALMLLCLCACGKEDEVPESPDGSAAPDYEQIYEVDITPENLFDFFEFKTFRADTKATDGDTAGEVTSVQLAYGFALRQGYTAANDAKHKDTLKIGFTATGVVRNGNFDVNFATLEYTGDIASVKTVPIEGTLSFWPKGDRTTTYVYGNYSDSYVLYLEDFSLTSVEGTVFIKLAPPAEG